MRTLLIGFVPILAPGIALAAGTDGLIGNWKLVSNQVTIDNGPPFDYPGPNPKGFLILTAEGRMMAFIAAGDDRRFGPSDADQAKLFRSMLAYTGKYRLEGDDFVTSVDASWNQEWTGTEQRHHYTLAGDTLTIVSAPVPVPGQQEKTAIGTLVWEREK